MILARSGNDSIALGIVNAVMGIGGIVGGLIVAAGKSCIKEFRNRYMVECLR